MNCTGCGSQDFESYGHHKAKCKVCSNKESLRRQKLQRAKVVEELGGKCSRCGYDEFITALDVHHPNPEHKDPAWKNMRSWGWERIKKEINNCVLLCKNCHSGIHYE